MPSMMAPTFALSTFTSLLLLSSLTPCNALVTPSPLPATWSSLGCYTDNVGGVRTLGGASYADNAAMTDESCITYCTNKGYIYAGTEYASECYCANTLATGSGTAPTTDCNMACSGNSTEACGGPNRLNLFQSSNAAPAGPVTDPGPTGWAFLGCYAEGANGRTLTTGMATTGGGNALTVALCTSACKAGGFTYAGVEYASECYCGNAISNGGGPASDGLAGCNMVCNGNSSEYCGGPNRLDVYQVGSGGSNPSTTSTASLTTRTVTATGLPSGWSYAGCYAEPSQGRAVAANQQPDNQQLTIESCIAACSAAGYTVAGMEYSVQCFCDNYISNGGALASADSQCAMTCSGNANEICGGPGLISVYSTKIPVPVYAAPAVQTTNLPGSWTYQGCLQDNANQQRTFPWQLILTNTNQASSCLTQCAQYGYMAAGMEYGDECYCGDQSNIAVVGAQLVPDSQCNVPCSGNASTLCGAGSLLSYYNWTGTPINTWHRPQGSAAGEYQLLVGGVCIPLLTTPGVNGKYTFVEKFGTGEANSTGAYELDVSLISNPTGAWRTMHVKTDVFCSAGVTLPDRVGRQINIGGWSGDSTFGIRLYWPDGSPGTPGVNDWQENVSELSLQVGRWYPSAMIMTNGSILVVGGEVGSNGAPQPTLELLPRIGPLVTLPFLQQTDPFNLYPFLCVLPSGGIFIAYYNQALIMDAGTFATVKQMPQIPGPVNNPAGGRTYPLEGTAVLMPQHAPYTDPLTVLICGGSTPGPAQAIDNCVSIQPDAPNPQWVIERMPSQRVISCMTALPDGTYLILNGALHGVAGFGLATGPNLNAVLYDPRQPVNSRFSIMATTIVARLYHSEAILMQDGRVMVSGSDPQDGVNPEEYRVEAFYPPYLLSGLTQPSFTITNKDWTYGASITIGVTLAQGPISAVTVSLMGAETSTHGNSMGQRTIFPAVACSGTSCTITAPPNANICPPGWYQLFVLDGPTPSHSTWVRIGGDPGQLGNWPNYPDFNVPGV